MKKMMKRIGAVLMAVAMMAALGVTGAFAAIQSEAKNPTDADNAKITINNPAMGETYEIYKLFDATVSADGQKIAYQGTVPNGLGTYFTADAQGYIYPTEVITEKDDQGNITGTKMTDQLKADLEAWTQSTGVNPIMSAISDGSEALEFTGLPYGYYVMVTTHKSDAAEGETAKALITVDSTKPNATINDKNINTPKAKKEVNKQSFSIGDTITYTATFDTTNYMGEGENAKQVVDYVITDTLPPYLSDVTVTSVTIGGTAYTVKDAANNDVTPQFDANNQITIPWAKKDETVTPNKFTSLYAQGTKIVVKYTAKLTSTTNINAADKNTVSIKPIVDNDNGGKEPWDREWKSSTEIKTYAAAVKKVDDNNNALKGAQFTIKGLTVEETEKGVYTVVSYDPTSDTESAVMDTDDDGMLYIVGLASDVSLTVTEYKAPDGYNKLTTTETLTPQMLNKQLFKKSGYEKYDADGNLIDYKETSTTEYTQVTKNLSELDAGALKITNKKGTQLPSTGGIGTYVFTIAGVAIMAVAAGLLVIRHKKKAE